MFNQTVVADKCIFASVTFSKGKTYYPDFHYFRSDVCMANALGEYICKLETKIMYAK